MFGTSTWRIIGDLESRAASRAATTVEDEVTLMAGIAKPLALAYYTYSG
jgi:hypothetical protein